MRYPQEYEREENVNTPEYWRVGHRRSRDVTPKSHVLGQMIFAVLSTLPDADVIEYGFGRTALPALLGADRWRGVDFCPYAVQQVRNGGYTAEVGRCNDAKPENGSTVIAIEVLEHLDLSEMLVFLERVKDAPHAFFSVPQKRLRDTRFDQHMRTFGYKEDYRKFLAQWWPNVEVEKVGMGWLLAHCSHG